MRPDEGNAPAESKQRSPLVEESEGAADADDDRKEEKAEEDKARSLFETFDANDTGCSTSTRSPRILLCISSRGGRTSVWVCTG